MTYVTGSRILAADFNSFNTSVSNIWGTGTGNFGYGQTTNTPPLPALPTISPGVTIGEKIFASDWNAMVQIIGRICLHQNTSSVLLPPIGDYAVGQLVKAFTTTPNLPSVISAITTNVNAFNPADMTIVTTETSSTRTTTWGNGVAIPILIHEFTVTFTDEDSARWYFNSGGSININATRTGGTATPEDVAWTNLFFTMGTISVNIGSTTQSGSGGFPAAGVGYYQLTPVYQQIFLQHTGGIYYSADSYTIQARVENVVGLRGGNGNVIRFRAIFNDAHIGGMIDGTLISNVGSTRATVYLNIPDATYATTIPIT